MQWRTIERIIRERFEVVVEIRKVRNKYFIRQGHAYYEITSCQFDRLLESGYINPDYRIERDHAYETESMIYSGR